MDDLYTELQHKTAQLDYSIKELQSLKLQMRLIEGQINREWSTPTPD